MEPLSCCTYDIRLKLHFSILSIRFQECAKYLIKCFDETIQIQFQLHYN